MLLTQDSLDELDPFEYNDGVSPYNQNDKSIENGWKGPIEIMRDTVRNRLGFIDGDVLDLLCGHGRWSIFLAEANKSLLGIDRVEGAVKIARGVCNYFELNNAAFENAEYEAIFELESESFDYIWLYGALQYIDRQKTIQQCIRLLRPGGRIFVSNYNSTGLMLTHIMNGAKSGQLNEGSSQWALNALQRGEFAHGTPSYSSLEGVARLAEDFSVKLIAAAPDGSLDIRDDRVIQGNGNHSDFWGDHHSTIEFLLEKPSDYTTYTDVLANNIGGSQENAAKWIRKLLSEQSPPIEELIDIALRNEGQSSSFAADILAKLGGVSVEPVIKRLNELMPSRRVILSRILKEIGVSSIGSLMLAYNNMSTSHQRENIEAIIIEILEVSEDGRDQALHHGAVRSLLKKIRARLYRS